MRNNINDVLVHDLSHYEISKADFDATKEEESEYLIPLGRSDFQPNEDDNGLNELILALNLDIKDVKEAFLIDDSLFAKIRDRYYLFTYLYNDNEWN